MKNGFTTASMVVSVPALIALVLTFLASEAWCLAALPLCFLAAYLDHLGIEKDMRDFLSRDPSTNREGS